MPSILETVKAVRSELEKASEIAISIPDVGGSTTVYNFPAPEAGPASVNPTRGPINHGTTSLGGSAGSDISHGTQQIGMGGGGSGAGISDLSQLERAIKFFGLFGDKAKQARENTELAEQIVAQFLAELLRRGALSPSLSDQLRIGGS